MCLYRVTKQYPKEDHEIVFGWQVVRRVAGGYLSRFYRQRKRIPLKVMKARERKVHPPEGPISSYNSGFHIWKRKKDAFRYKPKREDIVVVKVIGLNVICEGEDSMSCMRDLPVAVAQYCEILYEEKR